MTNFINFYISFLGHFLSWLDPTSPIVLVPISFIILTVILVTIRDFVYGR